MSIESTSNLKTSDFSQVDWEHFIIFQFCRNIWIVSVVYYKKWRLGVEVQLLMRADINITPNNKGNS